MKTNLVPILAALVFAAPLSAQVPDSIVTETNTRTAVPRAQPSIIIQPAAPLNVDSLAAILGGMDRELMVIAVEGQPCDCGSPWWWRAGLLGLGVGALVVWSRKEVSQTVITNTNEQSQSQDQTVTTTITRRGWWKKGKPHGGHGR